MLPTPPKVTLGRVATRAGVSVPTASKVLNGRDDVAAATRTRVLRAARDLGYRSPKQRRAAGEGAVLVDLVIDRLSSAYSMEVMRGIVDLAASERVEIVISTISSRQTLQADGDQWAQRLTSSGRHGVILVTSEVDHAQLASFAANGIPVVLVDPLGSPTEGVPTVGATNWAGGRSAVEHLLELGHRRIAYLGGPERAECSRARLHGYLAALSDAGVERDPGLILPGSFDLESGTRGLDSLLRLPDPPTAVFAASDTIALGVIAEARRRGIEVPGQLSVVGFDGTQICEQSVPRLTSVAQPLQEVGRAALRTLLRVARGEHIDAAHVELATRLVVRDSTARLEGAPVAVAQPAG